MGLRPKMQYSVHLPTPFIQRHCGQLLPDWSCCVGSVLITIQQPTCNLIERTYATEMQKNLLRETFLQWGGAIATQLRHLGHLAEPFDPKTGRPFFSKPGKLGLDDVAVAHACLDFPTTKVEGCSVILHPEWGSAVYPSILLSSASPEIVTDAVQSVIGTGGAMERVSRCRSRSAYHHSSSGWGILIQ